MTDARCKEIITVLGYSLNPMSGIEGSFYTNNRAEDIRKLCIEILTERDAWLLMLFFVEN